MKEPVPARVPLEDLLRMALTEALRELCARDAHLFKVEAGERAVVHKLGARLTPVVEAWDGGWTVDAEDNRRSPRPWYPDAAYKYLVDVLGEDVKPAYPDLIVHRPGVDGHDGGNCSSWRPNAPRPAISADVITRSWWRGVTSGVTSMGSGWSCVRPVLRGLGCRSAATRLMW